MPKRWHPPRDPCRRGSGRLQISVGAIVSFSLGQGSPKLTQFGNLSHRSLVASPGILQEPPFRSPLHNNLHVSVFTFGREHRYAFGLWAALEVNGDLNKGYQYTYRVFGESASSRSCSFTVDMVSVRRYALVRLGRSGLRELKFI